MMRGSFSLFDMDSIIRKSGAERVGEDASMKLSEKLEDSGKEILLRAKQLSYHAGRKHITREDILLAASHVRA
jgi:histone H3/H4